MGRRGAEGWDSSLKKDERGRWEKRERDGELEGNDGRQITNRSRGGHRGSVKRRGEKREVGGDQTAIIREQRDELSFVCQLEG